jgi:hypothetical protein
LNKKSLLTIAATPQSFVVHGVGGIVLTAQGTRSHSSTAKGTTEGI